MKVLPLGLSVVFLAAAQEPPQPSGRLIDVGGYRVHIYCSGQGSPAVFVVGGLSIDWHVVQSEIAKLTTICTYDVSGTPVNRRWTRRRAMFRRS